MGMNVRNSYGIALCVIRLSRKWFMSKKRRWRRRQKWQRAASKSRQWWRRSRHIHTWLDARLASRSTTARSSGQNHRSPALVDIITAVLVRYFREQHHLCLVAYWTKVALQRRIGFASNPHMKLNTYFCVLFPFILKSTSKPRLHHGIMLTATCGRQHVAVNILPSTYMLTATCCLATSC